MQYEGQIPKNYKKIALYEFMSQIHIFDEKKLPMLEENYTA